MDSPMFINDPKRAEMAFCGITANYHVIMFAFRHFKTILNGSEQKNERNVYIFVTAN